MRKDLSKVLTEKPRRGSSSRNVKTGFHENGFDNREEKEDKYSLPKHGKMLMHSRDLGSHDESKDFTDVLGPLKKWVEAQVGRNWDKVYSEIKSTFPNTNKQNHHLIDTHLMGYIHRNIRVEKSKKGRKVYDESYISRFDAYRGHRELWKGDIYVDPDTHVLMKYKGGKERGWHVYKNKPPATTTGYLYGNTGMYGKPDFNKVVLAESKTDQEYLEKRGLTWVYCQYRLVEVFLGDKLLSSNFQLVKHHTLSKKELEKYGIENGIECLGKFTGAPSGQRKEKPIYFCTKCAASWEGVLAHAPRVHIIKEKQ